MPKRGRKEWWKLRGRAKKAGGILGRAFEESLERKVLPRMKKDGALADFGRYKPFSRDDMNGKDFWVSRLVGNEMVKLSFGVTTSLHSLIRARKKHPDVPQLHFSASESCERIAENILSLFENQVAAS